MNRRTRFSCTASAVSLLAALPAVAAAQTAAPEPPAGQAADQAGEADPDDTTSQPSSGERQSITPDGDIVVTGLRSSLSSAQALKRNADQIVDAVVAEDIGKLPDNNASEALARITGVQVSRSSDEAGGVQVRGLPDLTTTFNGREIFTAELRNVALQDFPAGALAGLEVYKTTSADQIEGGIAGLINVRSRRPFDFDGFEIAGAVRTTYSDQSREFDPNWNLLVTNRWNTGIGEIGALVNVAYTQLRYLTSSRFINGNIVSPGANQPITTPGAGRDFSLPESVGVFYDRGKRWRPSVNGAIQWRPTDNLEIYAEGLWQAARTDVSNDFAGLDLVSGSPTLSNVVRDPDDPSRLESVTVTPNFAAGEDIDFSRGTRDGETDTYQAAVGATLDLEQVKISTDFAYTDTSARYLDRNFDFAPSSQQSADVVFDVGGKDGGPEYSIPGFDARDPNNYILRGIFDRRSLATGKGVQWRTDLALQTELPVIRQIDFGFRFTDRDGIVQSGGRFAGLRSLGVPILQVPAGSEGRPIDAGFRGSDPQSFRSWYAPTRSAIFANIEGLRDFARAGLAQVGTPDALRDLALWQPDVPAYLANERFDAKETTYAVYGQFRYGFDIGPVPVDGVIGVRAVNTVNELTGTGLVSGVLTPRTEDQNYLDVLPSASFRARLTDELQLRLSATETRTRPSFGQLNPAINVNLQDLPLRGGSGNIDLQPIESTNYDASLEWYFSRTGSLTGVIFRRDVVGFINNLDSQVVDPIYGPIILNRPENSQGGRLQGAELAFTTFFDALPGWLSGFGTQLNATYIDASQTLAATDDRPAQEVGIPGVSKWSYNLIALYEKGPVSTRLAYNYRSRVVNFFNTVADQPVSGEFTRPIERLDFSLAVTPVEFLTITFDATNLTGAPFRQYRPTPDGDPGYPRDIRYESRLYALGARFRF